MTRRPASKTSGILIVAAVAAATSAPLGSSLAGSLEPFEINGDAIMAPLGNLRGDPARGRTIALDRAVGNCLICHRVPETAEPFQGDLGPDLAGVGGRLDIGQIRLRIVDQTRLNPDTMMPPYYRTEGLVRVREQFRDQPVLTAQQIEDVVAWLVTLR